MYAGKRAFDLALTVLSAPLWLPALAVIAVLVRVRLGSPVLFRQERAGMKGEPFNILKFRTMTDARDASGNLLPDAERLTRFGRMLRSSSLDELPELLNVLRGDMSLVGPRPLHVRYLSRYSADHQRRHDVRPGLTGHAQTMGRNAVDWPQRFDLDVDYVKHHTFLTDVRILVRTIKVVLAPGDVNAPGEATMREFMGYDDHR